MTALPEMTPFLSNEDKIAILEVPDLVTIDTEGVTSMLGLSFALDGFDRGFYLPFDHTTGNLTPSQQEHTFKILKKKTLIMHNALHDIRVLAREGCDFQGQFYCTMMMCHWCNEELLNYKLDYQSRLNGGKPKAMPPQMSMIIDMDGWHAVPVGWMDEYSGNDSLITHELFHKKYPDFVAQGFDGPLWETEQDFIRNVMGPMIDLGIKIDVGFCIKEFMRGNAIMEECIKELGFKPGPKALEQFLIKELGLPVAKHTKSCPKCYPLLKGQQPLPVHSHSWRPSFDKDAMEEYDELLESKNDERAKTILRYRGWQKTTTSNYKPYLELIDANQVLHPGYKLHGTKTRRLSCELPNLQQIPKTSVKDWNGHLKSAFIPRSGYRLWTVDFSQLQFRMTVAYAQAFAESKGHYETAVLKLIEIFNDPTRDVFSEMAHDMGWIRDDVKTMVYLILFGGGGKRASVAFRISEVQGRELVDEFNMRYPEIKQVARRCQLLAAKQGYIAYWTGQRRHFPRGSATHKAFNAVIQGGEAEIIKRAMLQLQKEVCNDECRMILQIHDEIAFEIAEGREGHYLPKAQKVMEEATVPFCERVGVSIKFKTSAGEWGKK